MSVVHKYRVINLLRSELNAPYDFCIIYLQNNYS
ncbi:hypothetical protein EDF73_110193 [Raoultella sp. BIGb0138]|nr:hypothetical protein EDF73_110193 [Raoultella sp. BIGb0138]